MPNGWWKIVVCMGLRKNDNEEVKRHLQEKNCFVWRHCVIAWWFRYLKEEDGYDISMPYSTYLEMCVFLSISIYLQGYTLTFRSIKGIMMMRRAEAEWMNGKRGDKKGGKIELFSLSVVKFRMNEDFFLQFLFSARNDSFVCLIQLTFSFTL